MNDRTKQILIKSIRAFTLAVMIVGIILIFAEMEYITIDNILNYTPENRFFAAVFVIVFYILESFTVIFPVIILQLCVGVIFPPFIAMTVNIIGLCCSSITQYYVGKFAGKEYVEKLSRNHPKIAKLNELKNGNEIFGTYMSRILCILPMDLVSLFWGSLAIDFKKYILGTIIGFIPGVIAVSLMGASLRNPLSPQFLISGSAYIVIFILSFFIYRKIKKH